MPKIKLSIVIPAFNEKANIESGTLEQVELFLEKQDYLYEVIVVDDGSRDSTVELVDKYIKHKSKFELVRNDHHGKAIAVMTGMLKARGEIVVFTDMDQATPMSQIDKFFPKFEQGFDVVIGSRHGRKGAPLVRKVSALGFAVLRNLILGLPFSDTQCGFKAFNQVAIERVFPRMLKIWQTNRVIGAAVNAGFDVEALYLAKKYHLQIAEVPVEWHYVGTERVQLIQDAFEAVKDMVRIKLSEWQKKYD